MDVLNPITGCIEIHAWVRGDFIDIISKHNSGILRMGVGILRDPAAGT